MPTTRCGSEFIGEFGAQRKISLKKTRRNKVADHIFPAAFIAETLSDFEDVSRLLSDLMPIANAGVIIRGRHCDKLARFEVIGLTHHRQRAIDLGILELTSNSGERVTRVFINITSFGIGGLTDKIVSSSPKWIGGKAAFFLGTLRAMVAARIREMTGAET